MSDQKAALQQLYKLIAKSSLFDPEYYLKNNPDVASAGVDPITHFLIAGGFEGRKPSHRFDTKFYLEQCPESATRINPLIHYLVQGQQEGLLPFPTHETPRTLGTSFEPERIPTALDVQVRLIAFYLPQFYPIPENDKHWGKGFTEWSNVGSAKPIYKGHYQPRLPGELGYYDLRLKQVLRRQMELARQHGIYGFCLHHYWFNGKKVLRTPLEYILEDKSLSLPFCLHWANESWTRRWDGNADSEIIIQQHHSDEDDILFIKDIDIALRDERYIRIDGKPLLAVYRADEFPDLKKTVERWREYCVNNGIGEIYVAMSQSFDNKYPQEYGCDGAIEYPPHGMCLPSVKEHKSIIDSGYYGAIRAYEDAMQASLERPQPEYTLFRGVIPGWDNSARTKFGQILADSSPARYQHWLEESCRLTLADQLGDERIVFINAWNEWAEGAYLEPDGKYGYAYLNATARAMHSISSRPLPDKVIIVAPSAEKTESQTLLLMKQARDKETMDLKLLLLTGGSLLDEFSKVADVLVLDEVPGDMDARMQRVRELCQGQAQLVLCTSPAVGLLYEQLTKLGCPILTIFQLNGLDVNKAVGIINMRKAVAGSSRFIVCSEDGCGSLVEQYGVPLERISRVQGSSPEDICDEILKEVVTFKQQRHPAVSVIVKAHNDGPHLRHTLDAIIGQSFQDFELICIDNGSTDDSGEIIRQAHQRRPLKTVNKKSYRAHSALLLAEAFEKAEGELVWVVQPGDIPVSTFLERMTSCFNDDQLALAYCETTSEERAQEAPPSGKDACSTPRIGQRRKGFKISGDEQLNRGMAFSSKALPPLSTALFRRSMAGEFVAVAPHSQIFTELFLYLSLLAHGCARYNPLELFESQLDPYRMQRIEEERPDLARYEFGTACQFILTHFRIEQHVFDKMIDRIDELGEKARSVKLEDKTPPPLNKSRLFTLFNQMPERAVQRPLKIHNTFKHHNQGEWLRLLCRSVHEPVIDGALMPGFPSRELQIGMVGSAYEETLHEVFLFYREIHAYMKCLGKPFNHNTTILDFGCGFGRIYRFFLKDVPQENLIGVDVDPSFLRICRDTIPMGSFYGNAPYPPLEFKDESFDMAYSYSVFSHLAEKASLAWIDELYRVLKPGGVLFTTIRQMEFLKQCLALKQKRERSNYENDLCTLFHNIDDLCHKFESGEFIYKSKHSNGVRSSDYYGDCAIPTTYVQRCWTKGFRLVDCFEDPARLAQSLVVLQKPIA